MNMNTNMNMNMNMNMNISPKDTKKPTVLIEFDMNQLQITIDALNMLAGAFSEHPRWQLSIDDILKMIDDETRKQVYDKPN